MDSRNSVRGVIDNDWRLSLVRPLNGGSFDSSFSYNGGLDRGYNICEQGTACTGSAASEMAHLFYSMLDNALERSGNLT
jgi:hypothetical protein